MLTVVRLAVTVRAECDRILNGVLAPVCQLNLVVRLKIGRVVRFAIEWRGLLALATNALGPLQCFGDNIRIAVVNRRRYIDSGWNPGSLRQARFSYLSCFTAGALYTSLKGVMPAFGRWLDRIEFLEQLVELFWLQLDSIEPPFPFVTLRAFVPTAQRDRRILWVSDPPQDTGVFSDALSRISNHRG